MNVKKKFDHSTFFIATSIFTNRTFPDSYLRFQLTTEGRLLAVNRENLIVQKHDLSTLSKFSQISHDRTLFTYIQKYAQCGDNQRELNLCHVYQAPDVAMVCTNLLLWNFVLNLIIVIRRTEHITSRSDVIIYVCIYVQNEGVSLWIDS